MIVCSVHLNVSSVLKVEIIVLSVHPLGTTHLHVGVYQDN